MEFPLFNNHTSYFKRRIRNYRILKKQLCNTITIQSYYMISDTIRSVLEFFFFESFIIFTFISYKRVYLIPKSDVRTTVVVV